MAYSVLIVIKSMLILLLEIIASVLLSIVIVPVGLLFALINEFIRLIISVILKIEYRGDDSRIELAAQGADNIWDYQKANNARISVVLLFCANPIDIVQQRKLYMSRVINHTTKNGRKPYMKLRKILTLRYGYNCHKYDENFDIDNHVKIWSGVENDPSQIIGETQLMNEILPHIFKDMDDTKPQWEEIIIPRFQREPSSGSFSEGNGPMPPVCSVRILRYHHGFMDGASNLLLWTACQTEDQGASFPYPVNPLINSSKVSSCQRFLYDLSCVILGAFTMVKSIINASRIRSRFVTPNYSGKRHFGWSESINVEVLRIIKTTYKSSVPSMLATAIGGAFRKLDEKYPVDKSRIGNPDQVTIGLVSALVPYPNHDLRNQFTVVHFPVHTGSNESITQSPSGNGAKDRLQIISQNMTKVGRDPMVYLNYFMFNFFGRFPFALIQAMMKNGGLPVIFSNVPMSTEIVEFWGNPVVSAAGWPPLLTNTGLGIVTMRYADHMRFCAVADDACLSPEALNYFLREVATELKELAAECSNFETVIHKADYRCNNTNLALAATDNSAYNSCCMVPKHPGINAVAVDVRRGSIPSQIIDTIE